MKRLSNQVIPKWLYWLQVATQHSHLAEKTNTKCP